MDKIFLAECDSIEGSMGMWQFKYRERPMFCFTDEDLNRMRIICPIALLDKLDSEMVYEAMVANFHSALDVKYAISDEIIWSVFIHPFRELSRHQVRDALSQVFMAAHTFGTTYSSTDLVFPEPDKDEDVKEKKVPGKKM